MFLQTNIKPVNVLHDIMHLLYHRTDISTWMNFHKREVLAQDLNSTIWGIANLTHHCNGFCAITRYI